MLIIGCIAIGFLLGVAFVMSIALARAGKPGKFES